MPFKRIYEILEALQLSSQKKCPKFPSNYNFAPRSPEKVPLCIVAPAVP